MVKICPCYHQVRNIPQCNFAASLRKCQCFFLIHFAPRQAHRWGGIYAQMARPIRLVLDANSHYLLSRGPPQKAHMGNCWPFGKTEAPWLYMPVDYDDNHPTKRTWLEGMAYNIEGRTIDRARIASQQGRGQWSPGQTARGSVQPSPCSFVEDRRSPRCCGIGKIRANKRAKILQRNPERSFGTRAKLKMA